MKIVNDKEFEKWKAANTDGYGNAVFRYAEDWANLMEERIQAGESLEDIAEQTSHQADKEGITGFMYGAAVAILAHHWEHGEQLRCWHNLRFQIQNEGNEANKKEKAVLNPAIIKIK